jgi:hypothetical protein
VSSNCVIAALPLCKHPDDEDLFVLGFDGVLAEDATITSVAAPVIEVVEGTDAGPDLAVDDEEATTAAYVTDRGVTIPIARGVQFFVSDGLDGVTYKVTLTVTTDTGAVRSGAALIEVHA